MVSKKNILINRNTHDELMECKMYKTETLNQVVIRLIDTYGDLIND